MRNFVQQKAKKRFINLERKKLRDKNNFPVIACLLKQALKAKAHNRATERKILNTAHYEQRLLQPGQRECL